MSGKFDVAGCVIAGNPGHVIKQGVNWDRRCPKKYNREVLETRGVNMSSEQETKFYCDGCKKNCEINIITRYHDCGRPAGTYAKLNAELATMGIQIDNDFTRKIYIPMLIDRARDLARHHCQSYTKQK